MKQELGNLMAEDPQQETINLLTYRINSLTSELTEARAEIERLDVAGIHSCHKDCQRPNCVLRRELKAVTEQRDRLAAVLNLIVSEADRPISLRSCSPAYRAKQALQSLTTNTPTSEKI